MSDCKSLRRRIWEHVVLPLDEGTEYAGSADEVAAKLATEDDALASALLAQAEKAAAEPHERADSAERRATTLQGAVAIAASFGIASGALLLDSNKIKTDGWRQAFAVVSFGFVFCLVAAGFRAVGAVYRIYYWRVPENEEIYRQAKMSAAAAKTRRATALLRTIARNQAIARWKVAYMRAAAWWFRLALLFLLADAVLLVLYAFFGTRIPHMHVPFDRSRQLDFFFSTYFLAGLAFSLFLLALVGHLSSGASKTPHRLRQAGWTALLVVNALAIALADHHLRGWRVHTPWLRYLGVVLLLVDFAWLTWSYVLLGKSRNRDIEPRLGGQLQTGGAFAVVRHPSYLGCVLIGVGAGFIYSLAIVLMGVGFAIVGYDAARLEEPLLAERYGEAYEKYKRCTRDRILPLDRFLWKSDRA